MGLDPEHVRLGFFGLNGVARIADGASLEQVRAELGAMLSNLEELLPDQPGAPVMAREYRPLIVPFRTWVVGDIEATLWILLGAVGFLLLIACANVANLFLVRAEARHGEVAIRAALGESRGRLVASVLLESLVLGVAGGLAALLLAQGAVRLLVRFGPPELPRFEEISIDAAVLLFGLAVSLAAGLLFGLLPAWRACALAASGHMTAGARGATSRRDRQLVRRGLVVVQLALALTLLVGSGLAVRSFQRLAVVDPGFDPVDVLTFALALPPRDYDTPDSRLGFYRQVVDRLRSLPGTVGAAASSTLPLDGVLNSGGHRIEGRPLAEGEVPPMFAVRVVSPGYFDAMRIALVEGRVFDRLDEERDAPVVIVSRSLARAQWPGESALGKGTRMGTPPEAEGEAWSRIVGVVEDVQETALHEEPPEMAYYPLSGASFVADVPWPMRVRGACAERRGARRPGPGGGARARCRATGVRRGDVGDPGRAGARDAGVRHGPARRRGRTRTAARRGRPVRHRVLHGHATAPRDRHPHGRRGAGGSRTPAGARGGGRSGAGRRDAGCGGGAGADRAASGDSVRDEPVGPRCLRGRVGVSGLGVCWRAGCRRGGPFRWSRWRRCGLSSR